MKFDQPIWIAGDFESWNFTADDPQLKTLFEKTVARDCGMVENSVCDNFRLENVDTLNMLEEHVFNAQ